MFTEEMAVRDVVLRYHQYLRDQLPAITANVARVYHVHGGDQPHLAKVHETFL